MRRSSLLLLPIITLLMATGCSTHTPYTPSKGDTLSDISPYLCPEDKHERSMGYSLKVEDGEIRLIGDTRWHDEQYSDIQLSMSGSKGGRLFAFSPSPLSDKRACAILDMFPPVQNDDYSFIGLYISLDGRLDPDIFIPRFRGKSKYLLFDADGSDVLAWFDIRQSKDESVASVIHREMERLHDSFAEGVYRPTPKSRFLALIPSEPALPESPTHEPIAQEKFESSSDLKKRSKAISDALAEQYAQLVDDYQRKSKDREMAIKSIEKAYQEHVRKRHQMSQKALRWFERNTQEMTILVTSALAHSYRRSTQVKRSVDQDSYPGKGIYFHQLTPQYDSDKERLHFGITNGERSPILHNLVASISPAVAKKVMDEEFTFTAITERSGGIVKLTGLMAHAGGESFPAQMTDMDFDSQPLQVEFSTRKIDPVVQADLELEESHRPLQKREWSAVLVDGSSSFNSRLPEWFKKPGAEEIVGYGAGKTLEDARAGALKELALNNGVIVEATQISTHERNINAMLKENTSSTVTLSTSTPYSGSYRLTDQEYMDGRWFVRMVQKQD